MRTFKPRQAVGMAVTVATALVLGTAGVAHGAESDYELPRMLVIGTPGTSSGSFASTNGWAPILQEEVGSMVRIIPEDSETMRYRRLTQRKDINVSSVSAAEMRFQTEGIGGYAATEPAQQRILWHHNDTPWGFVVSGDSDLHTLEDLKKGGVRVAKSMQSPPMITAVTEALPAFLGLSEEEAQQKLSYVPASSYAANCRSVVEGKADVAYCSPISSVLSEMEGAPGGIRWLPMDQDNTEGWDGYLTHRPMLVPTEIDLGVSTAQGVDGATSNFLYTIPADADTDFAYNLAKWLHQSFDSYKDTHPLAARMSVDVFRNYLDLTPLPVHEGTVKYLKEIGVWTEEDDAWNEQAIAKMERWTEARNAAMAEAQEAGVEIGFENQAYLDILNKHTKDLEGFKSRL